MKAALWLSVAILSLHATLPAEEQTKEPGIEIQREIGDATAIILEIDRNGFATVLYQDGKVSEIGVANLRMKGNKPFKLLLDLSGLEDIGVAEGEGEGEEKKKKKKLSSLDLAGLEDIGW